MGITNGTMKLINVHLPNLDGLRMVELGDQQMFCNSGYAFAKQYFENKGAYHVSIDWHGKNGVRQLDMTQPIPDELKSDFDILTNFGFSEHVLDQYQCFKNIHDMVRVGGLFLHELPGQPLFQGHEMCVYYLTEFFEKLAELNDYTITTNTLRFDPFAKGGFVIDAVLKKNKENFMSNEDFDTLPIHKNSSNTFVAYNEQ